MKPFKGSRAFAAVCLFVNVVSSIVLVRYGHCYWALITASGAGMALVMAGEEVGR